MKKTIQITSVISFVAAALIIIFGFIGVKSISRSYFFGLAIFRMMANGTVIGSIGNILGTLFTAAGFGLMGWHGFGFLKDERKAKNALLWGLIMLAVCALSLLMSLFGHTFNLGDVIMVAVPAIYCFAVFKSA